jgi:hypothetical protein
MKSKLSLAGECDEKRNRGKVVSGWIPEHGQMGRTPSVVWVLEAAKIN